MKTNTRTSLSKNDNKTEYVIVLVLFLLSASPLLSKYVELLAVALLIFMFLYFHKHKTLKKDIIIIIISITILNIANIVVFRFFSFQTFIGNYVRFLMPYFAIMLIGSKFPSLFIKVIKLFTIVSLVFYIPANIIPGFNEYLQSIPRLLKTDPVENNHFIIYTIEFARPWESKIPIFRNSGPTGEPGEFVGYLLLAMIFELILKHKLWTSNNFLFAFAIITTFSTTGYLSLFILLSTYYLLFNKLKIRFLLFAITIIFAYGIYFNFEFMHKKIDDQLNMIVLAEEIEDVPRDGRLPNVIRNLSDSFEYPIVGKGRNFETRYENWETMKADAFSNNTAAFPVQFGWPFFIFYTFLLHAGFKRLLVENKMNKYYSIVIVTIIYTLSLSQGFLLFPIFVALIYLRNIIHPRKLNGPFNYHSNPQSY